MKKSISNFSELQSITSLNNINGGDCKNGKTATVTPNQDGHVDTGDKCGMAGDGPEIFAGGLDVSFKLLNFDLVREFAEPIGAEIFAENEFVIYDENLILG